MKNQVNIRLTPEEVDLLETAVYLRRLKSPQDLLRPLLNELLADLAADPAVAAAIEQRNPRKGEQAASEKVTAMASKRAEKKKP